MKTRVISGLAMLPLLLIFYLGGYPLAIMVFIAAAIGMREFFNAFKTIGINPSYGVGMFSLVGLYAIYLAFHIFTIPPAFIPHISLLWVFVTVLACMLILFDFDKHGIEDSMSTLLGIFYLVFFSFHIVLIDHMGEYRILIWLVIMSAFGTDIFAYFVGMTLGKHKLAPRISPKKSIEGSIGGVVGSVIICSGFGILFAPDFLLDCLLLGLLGGVVSQLGDLTASIFKRKIGIKDYGNLIPGHGGVLDRVDSVLYTGPMVYYYIVLVHILLGR